MNSRFVKLGLSCLFVASLLTGCATTQPTSQAPSAPEPEIVISTKPAELYGKTWLLEGPANVLLEPQAKPDLLINENGRLNASTGCNTFFGNVTVDSKGTFASDLGGMSMMACPSPLDQQEDAFLRSLTQSSQYLIQDNKLLLQDSRGNTLLQFGLAE